MTVAGERKQAAPRRKWTADDDEVIRKRYPNEAASVIADDLGVAITTLYKRANDLGVKKSPEFLASPASGRRDNTRWIWTADRDKQLRERYPDEAASKLAADLGVTLKSLYGRAKQLGVVKSEEFLAGPDSGRLNGTQGVNTRYMPGNVPWIAGTKGVRVSPATEFKPGQRAHNYMEVGARRVVDGYWWVKVAEGGGVGAWCQEHRLIWERHHGKLIPDGHRVAFRDGDPMNLDPTNLELTTISEIGRRNAPSNLYPPELVELIILKGTLTRAINKRNKS